MRIPKRKLNVVKWGIVCDTYSPVKPYFVSGNNDAPLLFETRQDARNYRRDHCHMTCIRYLVVTRVSVMEMSK